MNKLIVAIAVAFISVALLVRFYKRASAATKQKALRFVTYAGLFGAVLLFAVSPHSGLYFEFGIIGLVVVFLCQAVVRCTIAIFIFKRKTFPQS